MRLRHCFWRPLALLSATMALATPATPAGNDLLIVNARIFGKEAADALLIRNGRIAAVGRRTVIAAALDGNVPLLDAHRGIVVPGFHDAHIHMLSGGLSLLRLNLEGLNPVAEVVKALAEFAGTHPADEWVLGRGWQYDIAGGEAGPSRHDIDLAVRDRPAVLTSYDGHSIWVNSRALTLARIDPTTPDPPGGRIIREADGKTPSGLLYERAAALVWDVVPPTDRSTKLEALQKAIAYCLKLGITSVDDIGDAETFELYDELLKAGKLPVRVTLSPPLEGDLDDYETLRGRHASPFLRFGFLKGFVDGVIESKTALMLAPFTDDSVRGTPLIESAKLRELVSRSREHSFMVGLHAIGDSAVRMALDAFSTLQQRDPEAHIHGRIEHIEALDPGDVARFGKLGVVASMMPLHAIPSGDNPDDGVWSKNLGPERLRHSFAWRELLDSGATLAFGSDWPVMSADPLWGIAVATTRQNEAGRPVEGWNPHQRILPEEAVAAYTVGSAVALGVEQEVGKLEPGYLGDLVVLNPAVDLAEPASLWRGDRVEFVVIGGVVRFSPMDRR